jgi:iron complex outermembrane receptor protein
MYTASDTTAFSVDADILLAGDGHLRIGAEHRRYQLNDWWPPSGAMMWPGTFDNISNGSRDRSAFYAEWEYAVSPRWATEVGMRFEHVHMDADAVQGYDPTSNMMESWQLRDASAFNASRRERGDDNLDFSAIVRYRHDAHLDVAFGASRKVRSPSLYEVYPWSTWQMAALMNNFVGDGNGYVGNLTLRPEKAVTVSATFDWHADDRRWAVQATPYLTRVTDYIDAVQWDATTNAPSTAPVVGNFTVLKYANTSARLYGVDLSGQAPLGEGRLGRFSAEAVVNYVRGENTRTDDGLYNIMPLNARLSLVHRLGAWDSRLVLLGVARKDHVSEVRNELPTPGYALLNLQLSRSWDHVRLDLGVDNLFDRFYWVPTGGAYVGQGTTMTIPPLPNQPQWGTQVPGMGRSLHVAVNYRF